MNNASIAGRAVRLTSTELGVIATLQGYEVPPAIGTQRPITPSERSEDANIALITEAVGSLVARSLLFVDGDDASVNGQVLELVRLACASEWALEALRMTATGGGVSFRVSGVGATGVLVSDAGYGGLQIAGRDDAWRGAAEAVQAFVGESFHAAVENVEPPAEATTLGSLSTSPGWDRRELRALSFRREAVAPSEVAWATVGDCVYRLGGSESDRATPTSRDELLSAALAMLPTA